jgi:hypothetical protein
VYDDSCDKAARTHTSSSVYGPDAKRISHHLCYAALRKYCSSSHITHVVRNATSDPAHSSLGPEPGIRTAYSPQHPSAQRPTSTAHMPARASLPENDRLVLLCRRYMRESCDIMSIPTLCPDNATETISRACLRFKGLVVAKPCSLCTSDPCRTTNI